MYLGCHLVNKLVQPPCQQLFSSLQKVQIDKQDSLKKINAFIVFYSLYSI